MTTQANIDEKIHLEVEKIQIADCEAAEKFDKAKLQILFRKLNEAVKAGDPMGFRESQENLAKHVNEMFISLHGTYCTHNELLKDVRL